MRSSGVRPVAHQREDAIAMTPARSENSVHNAEVAGVAGRRSVVVPPNCRQGSERKPRPISLILARASEADRTILLADTRAGRTAAKLNPRSRASWAMPKGLDPQDGKHWWIGVRSIPLRPGESLLENGAAGVRGGRVVRVRTQIVPEPRRPLPRRKSNGGEPIGPVQEFRRSSLQRFGKRQGHDWRPHGL